MNKIGKYYTMNDCTTNSADSYRIQICRYMSSINDMIYTLVDPIVTHYLKENKLNKTKDLPKIEQFHEDTAGFRECKKIILSLGSKPYDTKLNLLEDIINGKVNNIRLNIARKVVLIRQNNNCKLSLELYSDGSRMMKNIFYMNLNGMNEIEYMPGTEVGRSLKDNFLI